MANHIGVEERCGKASRILHLKKRAEEHEVIAHPPHGTDLTVPIAGPGRGEKATKQKLNITPPRGQTMTTYRAELSPCSLVKQQTHQPVAYPAIRLQALLTFSS